LIRRDRADFPLRRRHLRWIGGEGAQDQRHGKRGEEELAIVEIHLRLRIVAQIEIAHVVDHAHDGGERSLAVRRLGNPLADRVLGRAILADPTGIIDLFKVVITTWWIGCILSLTKAWMNTASAL